MLTCRLLQSSAHAPAAEARPSTKLPAWQQNTFTDKAFYYFYSILFQPQPWKKGFRNLKDAPIRTVAVSFLACCKPQRDFKDASSSIPIPELAINCALSLDLLPVDICDLDNPGAVVRMLCRSALLAENEASLTLTLIICFGRVIRSDAALCWPFAWQLGPAVLGGEWELMLAAD